jgi:hypothetical protein
MTGGLLEKLWKAAYVFHAEGSLEADLSVLDRTLRILHAVANYLYRNRSRMRYDEYLANGRPIPSGPVEGARKNLIKDCMERSGMRWTQQMAADIVQLRAIFSQEILIATGNSNIDQDQRRLYPID